MPEKTLKEKVDAAPSETIAIHCVWCGKTWEFPHDSLEAQGIFDVFCKDDDCEDKYAARL